MLVKLTHENETIRHMDLEKLEIDNSVYRHLFPYHIVVLAKNQQGIKDLYELISLSHIDYLNLPKTQRIYFTDYYNNVKTLNIADTDSLNIDPGKYKINIGVTENKNGKYYFYREVYDIKIE